MKTLGSAGSRSPEVLYAHLNGQFWWELGDQHSSENADGEDRGFRPAQAQSWGLDQGSCQPAKEVLYASLHAEILWDLRETEFKGNKTDLSLSLPPSSFFPPSSFLFPFSFGDAED